MTDRAITGRQREAPPRDPEGTLTPQEFGLILAHLGFPDNVVTEVSAAPNLAEAAAAAEANGVVVEAVLGIMQTAAFGSDLQARLLEAFPQALDTSGEADGELGPGSGPPPLADPTQTSSPKPFGVPRDVMVGFDPDTGEPMFEPFEATLRTSTQMVGPVPQLGQVPPRYYPGHELSVLTGMGLRERARFQVALADAGLMPDDFTPNGIYDPTNSGDPTLSAIETLMGVANAEGITWEQVMTRRMSQPVPTVRRPPRVRLKPDPATLREDVREYLRRQLGRDPSDAELADLVGARAEGIEEAAQQEAVVESFAGGAGAAALSAATGALGIDTPDLEFNVVDPAARFAEVFRERYAPEIEEAEAQEETAGQQARFQSTVGVFERLGI